MLRSRQLHEHGLGLTGWLVVQQAMDALWKEEPALAADASSATDSGATIGVKHPRNPRKSASVSTTHHR